MEIEFLLGNGKKKKITLHSEDADKYIVLTFAKNEDRYIVEFVKHYLKLGFDKIIIVDNNDKPTLDNILSEFIKQGTVELLDFRGDKNATLCVREVFLNTGIYKWCGVFDCDEFLELNIYDNIKDFLSDVKENCVVFNWLFFSADNNLNYINKPLKERFTKPVSPILYFKDNVFVKSIVRGGDCWKNANYFGTHIPFYMNNKEKNIYNIGGVKTEDNITHQIFPFQYKHGYVKHYYSKSHEEFLEKKKRGYSDLTNEDGLQEAFNLFYPNRTFDTEQFIYTIFENDCKDNKSKFDHDKELFNCQTILLDYKEAEYYTIITDISILCDLCEDKTFILYNEKCDVTAYTTLLEIGFHTNNKIILVNNEKEKNIALNKYAGEQKYYILNDI